MRKKNVTTKEASYLFSVLEISDVLSYQLFKQVKNEQLDVDFYETIINGYQSKFEEHCQNLYDGLLENVSSVVTEKLSKSKSKTAALKTRGGKSRNINIRTPLGLAIYQHCQTFELVFDALWECWRKRMISDQQMLAVSNNFEQFQSKIESNVQTLKKIEKKKKS